MNMASALRHQAVTAAKQRNWERAVELNTAILEHNPEDESAYNRLGVAYLQLSQSDKAKEAFSQVLTLDKTNAIAKKYLTRIKNNSIVKPPSFSKLNFIEEPGKTKTVDLHRLAGRQAIDTLSVGQSCELILKKRYISVEVDGTYVGALPEDISYRLAKLIETGNTYSCTIRSCAGSHCAVYLRELSRSEQNKHIHSFPPSKAGMSPLNDVEDNYILKEDIPFELVETDEDDSGDFDSRNSRDDASDDDED